MHDIAVNPQQVNNLRTAGGKEVKGGFKKRSKRVTKNTPNEKWVLFYANARGLNSKKLSLLDIFGELNPEIALFTETMLKSSGGFSHEGYTFFGKSRKKKACGGVGILVRNDCKPYLTPHETDGEIELIWVSLKRGNMKPIFIGVYYGKQETRNNRDEMLNEMHVLSTEIHDKLNDGEVLLLMDGNGKIGLLGEDVSRNGALLNDVFQECELNVLNRSPKCQGKVTRVD